ncbi:MAG: hypothetical protein RL641_913 [Candidatus Parcubacteria bacterium]|jgi:sugar-specific transcriptional regulator TrmB
MIEKVMHSLGLGNKEQTVYKLILEHGKIAPAFISRLAKINRTTVYGVAKELKDKGLIVEDLGGKTLYYLPAKEKELEKVIEAENEKIKHKVSSIRELQDFLKNIPESKTYSVPKIRFVDEVDLDKYLFEAAPRWNESMKEGERTWWGFQDHTFVEKFEKWIDWIWKEDPKDWDLKLFSNNADVEKKMIDKKYSHRRHIKPWATDAFSATQWIVGSYVIMIITKQRPYYLIEIHDAVMAHNLREVFKGLWDSRK